MSTRTEARKAKETMTIASIERRLLNTDFLSIGVTLLNLGTYGRVFGGMAKGFAYRVIGKSQSAKSFLCRTILAEAAINPAFDDFVLIHDDIERGVLMDTAKFFGQKLVARIRAPRYDKQKQPVFSRTIMDLYNEINKKLKDDTSFIWIVDSQDSLASEGTTKMGDGKAKIHADQLRQIIDGMQRTGSILIFVHHAKVNIGFGWGGDVTTGGASPEFYSTLDIRLMKLKSLKKLVNGVKYPIGNQIGAHVTKNRISGIDRTVRFNLYVDYGIDDIGSNIDYLVSTGHWERKKGVLVADEFDFEGPTTRLIKKVETDSTQRELQILTGKVWKGIEDACSLNRRKRYE